MSKLKINNEKKCEMRNGDVVFVYNLTRPSYINLQVGALYSFSLYFQPP